MWKQKCTAGWCGLSHGESGQMTGALLLVAWPYEDQVVTSFRYATGYNLPTVYTGDAKLTQISSSINGSSFEVIYRCENCYSWNQNGATGSVSTSSGSLVIGYAQAQAAVANPSCPDSSFSQHDVFGQYGGQLSNATNSAYTQWTALATKTTNGACGGATTTTTTTSQPTTPPTTTPIPSATPSCAAPSTDTYDYVVVGAGAGGIPIADRLSDAGHKVLLIEKGPPSSGRYNGTMKPQWLQGTNLTRFDVPGLCNQIWVDSAGVACTDTDQMAGCVLGGGTAVNAGLWWKVGVLNPINEDVIILTISNSRIPPTGTRTSRLGGSTKTSNSQRTAPSPASPGRSILLRTECSISARASTSSPAASSRPAGKKSRPTRHLRRRTTRTVAPRTCSTTARGAGRCPRTCRRRSRDPTLVST